MNQESLISQENKSKIKPFEFQNWSVYQKARICAKDVTILCETLPKDGKRGLVDQISRASQSVCLNIAEGCARSTSKDKANFFRMAKGSLFECVAVIDLLEDLQLISVERVWAFQESLADIGKMLSGLIRFIEKDEKK